MIYKNNSRAALNALEEEKLSEYNIPDFVFCSVCGCEIYEFESLYEVASECVCSFCMREVLFDMYADDYLIRAEADDDGIK